ncbi:MAG: sterol desaturase family protein [Pseudomonadota bacterium]
MNVLLHFLAGIALWPAVEYALHSGLGHLCLRGKTTFSREHLRHHAEKDFFAPAWKKTVIAIPVFGMLLVLVSVLSPLDSAAALTLGFALMYATYESIHRRAHTHGPSHCGLLGRYSRWVRRNHFSHHFQNPRRNHGVTTPLFDYLFGTHVEPGKIIVPERFAMRWLCDPVTGDLWPNLACDYELKKASAASLRRRKDDTDDYNAAFAMRSPEH